jgi:F420 biosynthesis protein FbiB-like protein
MNSAQEFLRTRRSIRRFGPEAVPDAVIQRILETATYAPSAHHREPWRFAVLNGPATRKRLAEVMGRDFARDLAADGLPPEEIEAQVARSTQRLLGAPLAILLCLDESAVNSHPNPQRAKAERSMVVQSVAAAGLQLLLAAHAEGLGGVWVCSPLFIPATIKDCLDLPGGWEPQAMFFIGYPEQKPKPREKRSLAELVKYL